VIPRSFNRTPKSAFWSITPSYEMYDSFSLDEEVEEEANGHTEDDEEEEDAQCLTGAGNLFN
jgi:hypothetical protein